MNKHSVKYGVAIAILFLMLGIGSFTLSHSQRNSNQSQIKNSSVPQQLETVDRSYETAEEQEEVPHFNLFSIINKFIPN